ncbi:hypothetical protein ACYOEI_29220, partial [Singulisphaera rosea]
MRRRSFFRSLLTLPLVHRLTPWIPSAFAGELREEADAALIYSRAFDCLQTLNDEDRRITRSRESVSIDDPKVQALIEKARPALKAIREAATLARCRWEFEPRSGEDLTQGYLNTTNLSIYGVASLSARKHAAAGRGREALDDLFATLTLAHRIGTGGVIIARLFECHGESISIQTLGRILPELDRPTLEDLTRRLVALPPPEPASATIGPESRFIIGEVQARLKAAGPVLDDKDWDEIFGPEEGRALKRLTGGDRVAVLAHLGRTGPAFAELARRLDLPYPGVRASLDEFEKAEREVQPLVTFVVASLWSRRQALDRVRALRA